MEVNRLTPIDAILTGNIDYWEDQGIRMAARKLDLPFLVLRREHECNEFVRARSLKRYSRFMFEGDGVAVFGQPSLKPLIESGACHEEQVVVTGAPRLDCWHDANLADQDADTIVLLSYRDPGYGAKNSFTEVLQLFVDHASQASKTSKLRFVVKAKSRDDARIILRTLVSQPPNVFIEHDVSLLGLFLRSRLIIGFNSLSVIEALLSNATVVAPFWGETNHPAERLMFHPSRDQHSIAMIFAESRAALSELIDRAALTNQRGCEVNRDARLSVVNQFLTWSPRHTASERMESWIRASIESHGVGTRTIPKSMVSLARGDVA